jgi:hypothetical protein
MIAALLALLLPIAVQTPTPTQPARDLFLHSARVPGVEIRFVDYHWQPALFEAMEKGTGNEPLATRNWVVARLTLETRPLTLEGKRMGVGVYAVALWPKVDARGMTVEVRNVDMREVLPNLNAIAPLPKGDVMFRGPARIETIDPLVERLDAGLAERDGTVTLTIRYGNRRISLDLTR